MFSACPGVAAGADESRGGCYRPHRSNNERLFRIFPSGFFTETNFSPLDARLGGCGCRTRPPPSGGWFLLNEGKKLVPAWNEEDILEERGRKVVPAVPSLVTWWRLTKGELWDGMR